MRKGSSARKAGKRHLAGPLLCQQFVLELCFGRLAVWNSASMAQSHCPHPALDKEPLLQVLPNDLKRQRRQMAHTNVETSRGTRIFKLFRTQRCCSFTTRATAASANLERKSPSEDWCPVSLRELRGFLQVSRTPLQSHGDRSA